MAIIYIGNFAALAEKYLILPIVSAYHKVKPVVLTCARCLFAIGWKAGVFIVEAPRVLLRSGHREKDDNRLIELSHVFRTCKPLLELSTGRYWWGKIYERKRDDAEFQYWILLLDETGLITIPNGVVKDSKLTRLGYRVAYVIFHYGGLPPIWYPVPQIF